MAMRFNNTIDWGKAREAIILDCEQIRIATAEYVAFKARLYCPVDTGHLESTIKVLHANTGDMSVVTVGAHYAVFVEYGHFAGLHGGGWVPANPFMRKAIADAAAAFPQIAASRTSAGSIVERVGTDDLTFSFTT